MILGAFNGLKRGIRCEEPPSRRRQDEQAAFSCERRKPGREGCRQRRAPVDNLNCDLIERVTRSEAGIEFVRGYLDKGFRLSRVGERRQHRVVLACQDVERPGLDEVGHDFRIAARRQGTSKVENAQSIQGDARAHAGITIRRVVQRREQHLAIVQVHERGFAIGFEPPTPFRASGAWKWNQPFAQKHQLLDRRPGFRAAWGLDLDGHPVAQRRFRRRGSCHEPHDADGQKGENDIALQGPRSGVAVCSRIRVNASGASRGMSCAQSS